MTAPSNHTGRTVAWTVMLVLLSGSPLTTLIFGALGPVLPLAAKDLGPNGAFIAQLLMSTPAMGVIIGGLISGWLTDRMGAKRLLLSSLGLYALFGSAGLYLQSTELLVASRLLLGITVAAIGTSIDTAVGAFFDDKARARVLGFQGACAGVVSVIALLSSGFLGEAIGWRAPFTLYLVALPLLALALFMPAPPAALAAPTEPRAKAGALLKLWPIYALLIPLYVALFMNAIQISFLLAEDGVTHAAARAAIIAGASVASGLAGAAYGLVYGRLGTRGSLIAILAFMGLGFAFVGSGGGLPMVTIGVALAGFGGGMLNPHVAAYLLARAAPEVRSRAIGLMFTALFVGDFLNPVAIAPLKAAFGIHGAFLAVSTALFAAAGVTLLLLRRRPRDEGPGPSPND